MRQPALWPGSSRWGGAVRYGFAVVVIVAAALAQELFWSVLPPSPQLFFYPAILLIARVVGFGPAVFGVAISLPILLRWFLPPYSALAIDHLEDVLDLVIYAAMAILVAILVDRLRRAERKARIAIEAAPVPTAVLASNGRIHYANPAFVEALGYPEADLQRMTVHDLVVPDDKESFEKVAGPAPHPVHFECRFTGAGGRIVDGEGTVSAIHVQSVERAVLQFVDVSRRKVAEIERKRAFEHLHSVLEECPAAIVIVREGGQIIESNAAAMTIYGRNRTLSEAWPPEEGVLDRDGRPLRADERPSARALRGERVAGLEIQVRRPDGVYVPLLVNAAPLPVTPGEAAAAVEVSLDITPLKQLEELRLQWNAVVAHDLRQPINSILLRTQLLAARHPSTGLDAELVGISKATRRLNDMVKDLLDASKLEVRQLHLARRDVDLDKLIAERAVEAQNGLRERPFEIIAKNKRLTVSADSDRLAQILDNLLSNAVKYGAPSTPIRIEYGRAGGAAAIAVSNAGEAISEDEIPTLFERFRRSETAIRKGIEGSGLGLYIAKELIVAHGGEITCTSQAGVTTFRFTIPLGHDPAEHHARAN